jgi:methionyl-tRNA synthetase
MKKNILITTPIFYPNAEPHIGSVHTLILGDFLTRAFKLIGYDVFYSTGTDENCEKVEKAAKEKALDTKDFVDQIAEKFKHTIKKIHVHYDRFIRTTDQDHIEAVKHFWNHMLNHGLIYKGEYSGYYSISDETFFKEEDLIDGKAPTGADVRWESFPAYFFRSSAVQSDLEKFYDQNPDLTTPNNRLNELRGFITNGLNDLCVSRNNNGWGIELPGHPEFVIYVWFDALTNYINVAGYPNVNEYWKGRVIHIVGKDISIFHGVHWPSMLLAHRDIKLFDDLFVHNWWLVNNEKMSKSKGNIINPIEIVEKYGASVLRFYCIKENLVKSDGLFDESKMIENFNSFMVGKFSNLVYRLWTILHRNNIKIIDKKPNIKFEHKLEQAVENLDLSNYLEILFAWCDALNQEIEHKQIWKHPELAKDLFAETLRLIDYFIPICPEISDKMQNKDPVILFKNIEL